MSQNYEVQCDCGSIKVSMVNSPKVHAFCHCDDCRNLLDIPYHAVVAWGPEFVRIVSGAEHAREYKYPSLDMTRVFCRYCGETVYNTNAMGWRLVSQLLISKCNNGVLPEEFRSDAHYYYDRRIIDIDDQLPKS